MLFRKTFRNALATLLGMALALAGGAAHAVINLDAAGTVADPVGTATISSETFFNNSGRTVTEAGTTYYKISITTDSADLRVTGDVDARATAASGRTLYIRLGLQNAVFARTISAQGTPVAGTVRIPDADDDNTADTTSNGITLNREFGGTEGDDFVVYSTVHATNGNDIVTSAEVVWYLHNELAILPNAPVTVTQSVHIELSEARRGEDPLSSKTKTLAVVAQSLRTSATPGQLTATVGTGFTQLSPTGAGRLGVLTVGVGGTSPVEHLDAQDGSTVSVLADVAQAGNAARGTGSLLTFKGDFSVGSFSQKTVTTTTVDCSGTTPLATRNAQKVLQEQVVVPVAAGLTAFCMAVPATNREEIMSGTYTVAVDYQGLTNAAFPPADVAETVIGAIRRDGTRVQIPYLTTFEGYTQRVVIVNRNRGPVTYSFNFVEEEGTTATPGDMAEGSVGANSTLVLKATDIVSLAGKTRTAATLDVVATSGSVDVATTQVNIDSQGTDTVIYESLAN